MDGFVSYGVIVYDVGKNWVVSVLGVLMCWVVFCVECFVGLCDVVLWYWCWWVFFVFGNWDFCSEWWCSERGVMWDFVYWILDVDGFEWVGDIVICDCGKVVMYGRYVWWIVVMSWGVFMVDWIRGCFCRVVCCYC